MLPREQLEKIYELLYERYGKQFWWPGETQFEIIVGAILTQNTNWQNVEKAIARLKQHDMLDAAAMHNADIAELAELIRPAGYYNIKAKRLKNFLDWLFENYDGCLETLNHHSEYSLREELLSIKGIGRETADSILLYAFNKPVFVVDTYTARILGRHQLIDEYFDYEQIKELFEDNLAQDTKLFNEFHALIVRVGKEHCKPKPKCKGCPLECLPHEIPQPDDF